MREVDADIGKQLMMHIYRDILHFVSDFYQTRGKPTKRMLAVIKN